jgi:ribosomal protein S1
MELIMVTKKETQEIDFESLLEKYDYKFQKGDLVKGVVCGFDGQGVMVDIGAKTFAVIPAYEAVEKGENIEEKFTKGQEGEFLIIRE